MQRILRDGIRQLKVREGFARAVAPFESRCRNYEPLWPVNMKKHLTKIIIVAVCALALGPLFAGVFGPEWRARWMLAWAANEYQNGHPVEAETMLRRASELSSELATDPEFWKLRFEFVFNKEKPSSDAIKTLFDESVNHISRLQKPQQPPPQNWRDRPRQPRWRRTVGFARC